MPCGQVTSANAVLSPSLRSASWEAGLTRQWGHCANLCDSGGSSAVLLRAAEPWEPAVRQGVPVQSKGRVPFSRDWYILGASTGFLRSNSSAPASGLSTGASDASASPKFQAQHTQQ